MATRVHPVVPIVATVGLIVTAIGVMAARQPASVWDGVYTAEQARRGEPLYAAECAECHGDDLAGLDMAPALVGQEFLYTWDGLALGDLFERLRISMPQGDPTSVGRQEKADILAYMLEAGGYPPGDTELSPRGRDLAGVLLSVTR